MILALICVGLMPSNLLIFFGQSLSEKKLMSKFVALHIQFEEVSPKKYLT